MPVLSASRTYLPGDLIYSEAPFVRIIPKPCIKDFCETCFCRSINLRVCKQCLVVKYCGKSCQKKDWKNHRLECKYMGNLPDGYSFDLIHLVGRVILKIKGKDWKSMKTSVLGIEASFDDIDSHYKIMTENPRLNLLYKELKEGVKTFIGAENMPSDVDSMKIIGKVIHNSFLNERKLPPTLSFFIGISMFEQECIPNSSFTVGKNHLKVWASKKILKGTGKFTLSYRRFLGQDLRIFGKNTEKPCKCSDCSLPYGESVLSKILDDKKAYSVIMMTESLLEMLENFSKVDMECALRDIVDDKLKMHAGVLGRTNRLHLKLLAYKCLEIGGHASEIEESLVELESAMRSVFGEYYTEMFDIYHVLSLVLLHTGELLLGKMYSDKASKLALLSE